MVRTWDDFSKESWDYWARWAWDPISRSWDDISNQSWDYWSNWTWDEILYLRFNTISLSALLKATRTSQIQGSALLKATRTSQIQGSALLKVARSAQIQGSVLVLGKCNEVHLFHNVSIMGEVSTGVGISVRISKRPWRTTWYPLRREELDPVNKQTPPADPVDWDRKNDRPDTTPKKWY